MSESALLYAHHRIVTPVAAAQPGGSEHVPPAVQRQSSESIDVDVTIHGSVVLPCWAGSVQYAGRLHCAPRALPGQVHSSRAPVAVTSEPAASEGQTTICAKKDQGAKRVS